MTLLNFFKIMRKASTMVNHGKYVWIDLEMTGLDDTREVIMEVCCILTSHDLNPIHPGYQAVLQVEPEKLQNMNEWCRKQHGKSGLTEACRVSQLTCEEAEKELYKYIKQHSDATDTLYLSGNSVSVDRIFLKKYMPSIDEMLHHRIIDVSTIKVLSAHWYPNHKRFLKSGAHRAQADILSSIEELKFYKNTIFKENL